MAGPFANEVAAVCREMPKELSPLHASALDFHGNYFSACVIVRPSCDSSVFLENEPECILEVSAGFSERLTLGIDPRNFFHPGDIPVALLLDHGGKLSGHRLILTRMSGAGRCSTRATENPAPFLGSEKVRHPALHLRHPPCRLWGDPAKGVETLGDFVLIFLGLPIFPSPRVH